MSRRKVIFISGPMTAYEDYNRAAFNAAAKLLENDGYTVLNPAVLPDGLKHEQYMQVCLTMLEQADEIYILAGWEGSVGARREVERASALGIDMKFQCWSALSACISGMNSDGRCFMRSGVLAMRDYFVDREASSAVAGELPGVGLYRDIATYCDHFLEVLDSIGVSNVESY